MKRVLLLTLVITFMFTGFSFSQTFLSYNAQKEKVENAIKTKGELYFRFAVNSKEMINEIGRHISIDNIVNKVFYFEVYAYSSEKEMEYFSKLNIDFELLKHPGDGENIVTSDNIEEITAAWNVYPTYTAYVSMMNAFAANYPNLCKIVNIGTTVSGRQLLFAVISDSVQTRKPKPRFMYSSSIHGDETTGYVLMLRLIDTLLSGYGTEQTITRLVKNCEIWINPLANPDGTYYGGDNTVNNARRGNYNNIDMNRNFQDPIQGLHPDGNAWQPEVIAMMNLFNQFNFTLSMNFHGGAQVFNYPWDSKAALHPDDALFIRLGRRWVDTVHVRNSSYMIDNLGYPNIPGIVNGYAWYFVYGGRQDFMTFFKGGREITAEISATKLLPQANLPAYWGYNFRSFLYFINETLYGIKGTVTDSLTNAPLKAKVYVVGQNDTTWIYSDTTCGDYHRMINAGTYSLNFTAPNYYPKTVTGITAYNDSVVVCNVKLRPRVTSTSNEITEITNYSLHQNYPNPFNPVTNISFDLKENSLVTLRIYDATGKEVQTLVNTRLNSGQHSYNWNAENFSSGVYFYKLSAGSFSDIKKMLFIK